MARPNLSYLKNALLVVAGVPCGLLTGLTGMTNSFVVSPLLTWLTGIRDARVIGSTLAVASFSALTGILAYTQLRAIDAVLTLGMAVGFLLGAALAQSAYADRSKAAAAGRMLGVAVAVALAAIMIADARGALHVHSLEAPAPGFRRFFYAVLLGACAGIAGRLLDLAGFLIVPSMHYALDLNMIGAQGSAVAILLLSSLPAMLVYARRGSTDPRTAVWVSFGALFGSMGGSRLAAMHCRDSNMLIVYATVMLAMVLVRALSQKS